MKKKNTVETKKTETENKMIEKEIISPSDESKVAKFEKRLAADGKYFDYYDNEYEFVSDPNVIGEWEAIDFTYDIDNWLYFGDKADDKLWIKKVEFKSDGGYLSYSKASSDGFLWKWTYGHVIADEGSNYFVNRYYLYSINNKEFLFVEFKNGDYMENENHNPGWYVFRKV